MVAWLLILVIKDILQAEIGSYFYLTTCMFGDFLSKDIVFGDSINNFSPKKTTTYTMHLFFKIN
jgi:hypothetical protein